jgi:hypothetical protein
MFAKGRGMTGLYTCTHGFMGLPRFQEGSIGLMNSHELEGTGPEAAALMYAMLK